MLLNYSKVNDDEDNIDTYTRLLLSTQQRYEYKQYIEEIPHSSQASGLNLKFFNDADSLYDVKLMGLCERISDTLDLQPTVDYKTGERLTEPHRLWNSDHFNDNYPYMSLYGTIPVLYSISQNSSTGIMMLNSSDTLVDFMKAGDGNISQWTHESGVIDLYIFNSPNHEINSQRIVELSGYPPMPLETSLGYNQSRWNYFTQDEFLDLNQKFTENQVIADFLWLDIEHTDAKMYFTWDYEAFPDPPGILQTLLDSDRQLMTQIDPHFKNNIESKQDE